MDTTYTYKSNNLAQTYRALIDYLAFSSTQQSFIRDWCYIDYCPCWKNGAPPEQQWWIIILRPESQSEPEPVLHLSLPGYQWVVFGPVFPYDSSLLMIQIPVLILIPIVLFIESFNQLFIYLFFWCLNEILRRIWTELMWD